MILLKMVRGRQGNYNRDDYVDLAAYGGLLGECVSSKAVVEVTPGDGRVRT